MSLATVEQKRLIEPSAAGSMVDSYPLSPLQQGMLFHALFGQQPGVDVEQLVFTISADLNVDAFARAWQQVFERHPVLRTSFQWTNIDDPVQNVHSGFLLKLRHEDWSNVSSLGQQEQLRSYLQEDRQSGFDLTQASLMRVGLFQIEACKFHFIWTVHHVLLDGRSFLKVLSDLYRYYDSLCRAVPISLRRPKAFRDHVESLRQIDLQRAEAFWRKTLEGFTDPTVLPSPLPATLVPGSDSTHEEQEILLSAGLTGSLKECARENQVTLYTLVKAAWALLLSRYSGEQDVVFGEVRDCRGAANDQDTVGLFINTIPIRVTVPDHEPVLAWLKELRSQHIELRDHERTPLPKIREWCDVVGERPLFDSIVVFEKYDLQASIQSCWSDWEIRDFKLLEQTNYPISLSCWLDEELALKIEYDRSRFDKPGIKRMLGHLATILQGMPSRLEQPVSSLPMLTSDEERQIFVEWNSNNPGVSEQKFVDQLLEEQAWKTPGSIAVISQGQQLSYSELNARANQLAHHLISIGVGPETLVGISVRRSVEMLVAMLGVLKAGGAYAPIDSACPRERLAAMLADSTVQVLLTESQALEEFPEFDGTVICLDTDWEVIKGHPDSNPLRTVKPENLAYLIYTSGSTGTPKGVLIEHRSLSKYVAFAIGEFRITPADRVLQFASSSFDTSAEEIYPCLARGATLVLRTDSMLSSVSEFLEQCRDLNITILDLPTAFWHELTASLVKEDLSLPESIRLVIIGGERALPERVADWRKHVRSTVRLLNTYGPTETTIVATVADLSVPPQSIEAMSDVSVGRPIPQARIYILDKNYHPTPVGVIGELHIGGAGLARGYLNHPDLTAEKFIGDPFSGERGARLYKTGDLARYCPDGNIQIIGRTDDQVKINGFRIELGEIEAVLRSDPSVSDAVVVTIEDRPGEKRLVAYIVARGDIDSFSQSDLRNQLRRFLKTRLPAYMIPSLFVFLSNLPVSHNGKVDRRKLPMPDASQNYYEDAYVRPRDPLEKQLAEIWEELLHVSPIGIRDNFFDLGGHSLLSVRMMSRIEQLTGQRLPLATLFESATIENLAASLLAHNENSAHSSIIEINKRGTKQPLFFLHGDFNGGGFYCLNLARALGEDQPFFAIQPHGLDDGPIPSTIESMAQCHLRTLRELQPTGPYLLGGYCNGATIAFEMARILESQGEKLDLVVLLCASVSSALRFKLLQRIVNCLGVVERLGTEQKLDRFLAYRERLIRVKEIQNYYRERLADISGMTPGNRIDLIRERASVALPNLARAFASVRKNGERQSPKSETDATGPIVEDRRKRANAAYARAIQGYVPGRFCGPVTLLWPSELTLEDPNDPTAGWSRVASDVDVHMVPGGHITCVTNHVTDLARALSTCLEKAHAGA